MVMDKKKALLEIVNSDKIEFVESSNVVFFMKGKEPGILYIGFDNIEWSQSDGEEVDHKIYRYNNNHWEARVYCYINVTEQQIKGLEKAVSKGEFIWKEFIYPEKPYYYLGIIC